MKNYLTNSIYLSRKSSKEYIKIVKIKGNVFKFEPSNTPSDLSFAKDDSHTARKLLEPLVPFEELTKILFELFDKIIPERTIKKKYGPKKKKQFQRKPTELKNIKKEIIIDNGQAENINEKFGKIKRSRY